MIGKSITLEKVRNAVECLRRNRMFWSGFFMFGFPTETEEEIIDTLNFLHELKPNWAYIGIFTPYPGTALYESSLRKGMIKDYTNYTQYSHHNLRSRRTDMISEKRFYDLSKYILDDVHKYNSSYKSLIKRAFTRNYHKNPRLIPQDFKKVIAWLRH